ncbi:hypothetical protein CYMTET_53926 [Cymbomonas tetramitiformis]|uniref:Chalcone isomerase domain-containing protein n=1 Tax=Cymbomonas tetramitiformis TaxID=36881 RepID=A0AAE0BH61_9CHLO|nr:hypothetical protein CYMTET_53926 [Cymbomonas tetramitiformis]
MSFIKSWVLGPEEELPQGSIKEYSTGVVFPETSSHGLKILGAGVRVKNIAFIGVKIYAFAMYADLEAAKKEVAAGSTLLSGAFDKAICLEFVREVDATTFWNALDEGVKPRLEKVSADAAAAAEGAEDMAAKMAKAMQAGEGASAALLELGEYFMKKNSLPLGTQVLIRTADGKSLQVSAGVAGTDPVLVGGKVDLEFQSPELCQALFDIYLGEEPLSKEAKDAFIAGLA